MAKIFGNIDKFAIEYLTVKEGAILANIFVAGQNITPIDNAHYDQFLIHGALGYMLKLFESSSRWFDFETNLEGDSIPEKFRNLWKSDNWGYLSVCDWAPCTSGYICAIIPYEDQLYLCCSPSQMQEEVYYSAIDVSIVSQDIKVAREYMVSESENPFLRLDIVT